VKNIQLIVGTGSTWSIRAWLCLKLAKVEFTEYVVVLEKPDFKQTLLHHSPTGLVPALNVDDLCIHDSLAISEFVNELANEQLLPELVNERALARSYCAELHSGFFNLRNTCPFAIQKQPAAIITDPLQQELNRLIAIFSAARGEFYFEKPSMVDAFYSVLAYRLDAYGIQLPDRAGQYQQALLNWPLFKAAITQAASWSE
jgi:glutathione S-transferase